MPNIFAYIVLYTWPIVVVILFKRLSLTAAIAWSIVAGYLLLPSRAGFDLPLIPTIDKTAIPSLTAAVMCLILAGGAGRRAVQHRLSTIKEQQTEKKLGGKSIKVGNNGRLSSPSERGSKISITNVLLMVLLVSPIITVIQNPEPIIGGIRSIKGLELYDAFSMLGSLLIMVIPFLLARRFFVTDESHVTLLAIIVISSMLYSLLAIYELRMGPFLNLNIYGFAQHAFLQHVRAGGFRPMIFLQHGLWVAVFTGMSVVAAAMMWRVRRSERKPASLWFFVAVYLFVILVWGKSYGAFYVTVAILPIALILNVRLQILLAACIAAIVMLYPVVRGAGIVPAGQVMAYVASVSTSQARSLQVRLDNEESLLAKANDKPLAGWGGWGRNRIIDAFTGEDQSVTDGMWIIIIGTNGWLGYISHFGLLCIPIFLLLFRAQHVSFATSGLCLLLTVNLIDLIPNATLTPVTWLVAGALMGRYESIRVHKSNSLAAGHKLVV